MEKKNKYKHPPETSVRLVLKKASLPPFPPEKVPCYNLFSFLSFPLIFLLYYSIDLFTCLTGEFSPFHSIVHS